MAVTTNEGKPASDGVSTLISGINMVFNASASATSNDHGKIVKVMVYVLFILIFAAYRLKNRNSTCYNVAEALGFLLGLALILIEAWRDATTFVIGLVVWAIFCAWETYFLCNILHKAFCKDGVCIDQEACERAQEIGLTQRMPKRLPV